MKIIWINPCYPSPQRDHGYDIADYCAINPEYGSLEGFELMLAEAHALGIRVIMDIVPNHASVEHAWFHEAIASEPGSPERARFIFTEGEDGGETPPNTWTSVFGGGAWHRVEDGRENPQWYLHLFDWSQPDFNWRNPQVREEFLEILRFWFERGVDGFRIDVAHGLVKPARIPRGEGVGAEGLWGRPEVHEVYEEWRALADSYEEKKYFIGEVWVDSAEKLARFTEPGRLHQSFAFELLVQPWFAYRLRRSIERAFAVAGAEEGPAWALSNHDVHRVVTRLGQEQVDRDPDPRDMLADARRRWPVDVELGVHLDAHGGLVHARRRRRGSFSPCRERSTCIRVRSSACRRSLICRMRFVRTRFSRVQVAPSSVVTDAVSRSRGVRRVLRWVLGPREGRSRGSLSPTPSEVVRATLRRPIRTRCSPCTRGSAVCVPSFWVGRAEWSGLMRSLKRSWRFALVLWCVRRILRTRSERLLLSRARASCSTPLILWILRGAEQSARSFRRIRRVGGAWADRPSAKP